MYHTNASVDNRGNCVCVCVREKWYMGFFLFPAQFFCKPKAALKKQCLLIEKIVVNRKSDTQAHTCPYIHTPPSAYNYSYLVSRTQLMFF